MIYYFAASILNPLTKNSLETITKTGYVKYGGNICKDKNVIKTPIVNILSANASNNAPVADWMLNYRADHPSKKSVMDPIISEMSAYVFLYFNFPKRNIVVKKRNGILDNDNKFGIWCLLLIIIEWGQNQSLILIYKLNIESFRNFC